MSIRQITTINCRIRCISGKRSWIHSACRNRYLRNLSVLIKIHLFCTSLSVILVQESMTVIEHIPLSVYLHQTTMIISNRHQFVFFFSSVVSDISIAYDDSTKFKSFHRPVTDRIAELMRIYGRIDQIIFSVYFSNRWPCKVFVSFK